MSEGFNFADVENAVDINVYELLYEFVGGMAKGKVRELRRANQIYLLKTIKDIREERSEIGVTYKKRRMGFT